MLGKGGFSSSAGQIDGILKERFVTDGRFTTPSSGAVSFEFFLRARSKMTSQNSDLRLLLFRMNLKKSSFRISKPSYSFFFSKNKLFSMKTLDYVDLYIYIYIYIYIY